MKTNYTAKPFVKWVGGKTQLLHEIEKSLPQSFFQSKSVTYVEPFVGGGAVLFWILQKYPNIERAVINDINPQLITTYRVIKESPNELISILYDLQDDYLYLSDAERKEYYIKKRMEYNKFLATDIETAALFIFLNRTCFNGLYRVNSKGKFNVPHGKYTCPKICDEDTILADSQILQKVEILCGDFAQTAIYAKRDTLYYFDPPYKPLSQTSSFTSYAKEEFDDEEQIRLRDFCYKISKQHSSFILSNSDVRDVNSEQGFFDSIYNMFCIKRVMASRMINSNPDKRGRLSEVMISNTNLLYQI